MKTLVLTLICVFSISAMADCKTKIDVRVFSNPFATPRDSKNYKKIEKMFKFSGFEVVETGPVRYTAFIETGVERSEKKDKLLSHFKIINKKGNVVFESYQNRTIKKDALKSTDEILAYAKRHLSASLPLCN